MPTRLQGDSGAWELHHGDALAVMRGMPDASVDAVITDPPYSSGGMFRGDRMASTKDKYLQTGSAGRDHLDDFMGDSRDQRGYGYWCALWLSECLRITRLGGACVLFTDWRQLPTTTDVLQAGGWVWRGIVPWWKPNGRNTQGRFANNCEYVVWGTAGVRELDASATLGGFFQANTVRDRAHIAQKPISVMRELVQIAPVGATILDPFCGSATTGVAALIEKRRFIGIEQSRHHVETAMERLRQASLRGSSRSEQDSLPLSEVS